MKESVFKRRIYFTGLVLVLVAFTFVIKLYNLHFSEKILIPESKPEEYGRGNILDRNGYILATSIEVDSVFANPVKIRDKVAFAKKVSQVLNISAENVFKKVSRKKKFIWLKRKCNDYEVRQLKALKLSGIGLRKEYQRVYPYDNLASNILGFVDIDNKGLAGVEYRFNTILSGRDEVGRNEVGRPEYKKKNIYLTIDRYIQYVAEDELGKALIKHGAKQGAVVVMDVKTGRVLAIAKAPSFNPNRYWLSRTEERKNFTVVDSYEPGSTLKVLSMAAIIENNPAVLKEKFLCKGFSEIGDVKINCIDEHGYVDVFDAIKYSCNSGMIQAMKGVSNKKLHEVYSRFGFGRRTGVELPGEANGILRPVRKWSGLSKYSMSIGHEISATSLQMVAAFGAVANDGIYNVPTIIEKIEKEKGGTVRDFFQRTRGRVLKKKDARRLIDMMRKVVEEGTGRRASSRFYKTLGKTGTSQKFARAIGGVH